MVCTHRTASYNEKHQLRHMRRSTNPQSETRWTKKTSYSRKIYRMMTRERKKIDLFLFLTQKTLFFLFLYSLNDCHRPIKGNRKRMTNMKLRTKIPLYLVIGFARIDWIRLKMNDWKKNECEDEKKKWNENQMENTAETHFIHFCHSMITLLQCVCMFVPWRRRHCVHTHSPEYFSIWNELNWIERRNEKENKKKICKSICSCGVNSISIAIVVLFSVLFCVVTILVGVETSRLCATLSLSLLAKSGYWKWSFISVSFCICRSYTVSLS